MAKMSKWTVSFRPGDDNGLVLTPVVVRRSEGSFGTATTEVYGEFDSILQAYTKANELNALRSGEEPEPVPEAEDPAQEAKADGGKPKLSLVPMGILTAIARVREYGLKKYGDPENWKRVEKGRYRDAMLRHLVAYIEDPDGKDAESGLPHLWHLACNIAFLVELEGGLNE